MSARLPEPPEVQGHCAPGFEGLQGALSDVLAAGSEVGAALAVYVDKQTVVDVWAGHKDAERTVPMERRHDRQPLLGAFGHFGAGGSLGFADPDARLAFGYAMNQGRAAWQHKHVRHLIDLVYAAPTSGGSAEGRGWCDEPTPEGRAEVGPDVPHLSSRGHRMPLFHALAPFESRQGFDGPPGLAPRQAEVVEALEIQPELRAGAEEMGESQSCVVDGLRSSPSRSMVLTRF